ncbi:MAG TPA: hypothetical protein VKY37_04765 [Brumimicrobium sp.]|nr:hypothetical protein [Brumimicrobium sp.]
MLSFVKVEANLLYIQEDELKPEFQNKLCLFSKSNDPLFIIVQLKVSPLGFKPMINNLKEIRMDKAKKKINNWVRICFAQHQKLVVKIIDDVPQSNSLYLDFTGIDKLSVYRSKNGGDQILPLVKNYFDSEKLNLQYFI